MSLLSEAVPVEGVLRRPHGLLEGPRFGPAGQFIYSDVLVGGVFACTADGEPAELLPRRRGIGGILPHADGGWVISGRSLLHLAPDGAQRELLSGVDACGYNDLGSTPEGSVLAGELRYRPMAGEQPRNGRLLLLGPGSEMTVLGDQLLWPNGIGLAPDGETVYVSDYAHQHVLLTNLRGAPMREFARVPQGSADGLAVDQEGGVWVALGDGGAVARFHPDGRLHEIFPQPAGFVSSISFGGADRRDVLITTADNLAQPELGGTLLRARSEIPGLPVYPVAV
jgi:L-arabinonolactonase